MITREQIQKLCPSAKTAIVDAILDNWDLAEDAGLTTPLRIAHFFARVAVETGGLRLLEESLNYSTAERIRATWPSRFKTVASAQPFVRQPKKLAIKVYGGRLGNAPAPSEDGWTYRGSGMLQSTGKTNIEATGYSADDLRKPVPAFISALHEWKKRGCNKLADRDDVAAVCKAIQGGTGGLAEQRKYLAKAKQIWTQQSVLGLLSDPQIARHQIEESQAEIEREENGEPKDDGLYQSEEVIKWTQDQLKKLGYWPGGVDGDIGSLTTAAILAFRADNNLPLVDIVDRDLMNALSRGKKRQLSPERENASAATVREKVPEAQNSFVTRVLSGISGALTAAWAAITGIFSNFDGARDYLDPVKEFFGSVPTAAWAGLIFMIAAGIYWSSTRAEREAAQAFKEGRRL